MNREDQNELIAAVHRLSEAAHILERRTTHGENSNRADININGGGVGVWLCATACMVMLACSIFMAVLLVDHARRISDLDAYLSAIYMQAPHLKPTEKESSK